MGTLNPIMSDLRQRLVPGETANRPAYISLPTEKHFAWLQPCQSVKTGPMRGDLH